jgi:hypothetical protein
MNVEELIEVDGIGPERGRPVLLERVVDEAEMFKGYGVHGSRLVYI